MPEFKVNIGDPKSGKTFKRILTDVACKPLVGKKIGDKVKGEALELPGYEFEIAGGSDYCGFPMRPDVKGPARKRVLVTSGFGLHKHRKHRIRKGMRKRRTMAGNTIYGRTAQVNLKILKHGKKPLVAEKKEAKEEAPKAEEKPAEAPKAEKKEPAKEEKKPVEKEAPKKEKKEAPKKEEKPVEKPKKESK